VEKKDMGLLNLLSLKIRYHNADIL
jgi:hypothetical protein